MGTGRDEMTLAWLSEAESWEGSVTEQTATSRSASNVMHQSNNHFTEHKVEGM